MYVSVIQTIHTMAIQALLSILNPNSYISIARTLQAHKYTISSFLYLLPRPESEFEYHTDNTV